MIKLRLARYGSKKRPFYRVVAAHNDFQRDGRFLEIVGTYDPRAADEKSISLKHDRIEYWISQGAQPSSTVASILKKSPKPAPVPAAQ